MEEGPNEVILINYEEQSLELSVADVTEFGSFPSSEVRIDLDHSDDLGGGSEQIISVRSVNNLLFSILK